MNTIKNLVIKLLNRRTAAFFSRNKIRVIGVVGSVGKTGTTQALRTVLAEGHRVHIPKTNYNTDKSIHCLIFDETFATNPLGWLMVSAKIFIKSYAKSTYELVVLELSTDKPGDIKLFNWLTLDLAVVTAIAPEHMANFRDLDAVAQEELGVQAFADELVLDRSSIDTKYNPLITTSATFYNTDEYQVSSYALANWQDAELKVGEKLIKFLPKTYGRHSLNAALAAATVASLLGLDTQQITKGLNNIEPVPGRMQPLLGIRDSLIIDDSYNSSPLACKAALDTLYASKGVNKIALLGQMNEFGDHSESAHREVGQFCDPSKLAFLITLGDDANTYLAEEAEKQGCKVIRTKSPYEAGEILKEKIADNSVVLVKGSQNKIFSEEAIKPILADPVDDSRLVRQSDYWMNIKRQQFPDIK